MLGAVGSSGVHRHDCLMLRRRNIRQSAGAISTYRAVDMKRQVR